MINQRNIAIFTNRHPVAGVALQTKRKAAPVLEKDDLFFFGQRFFDMRNQERAEMRFHCLAPCFAFDVGNQDFGHLQTTITLGQFDQSIFFKDGIMKTLDGGRCRTQQCFCAVHLGQDNGRIAGIVAGRRAVLFVRSVVFLVNNHQSKIAVGQEQRRSCAKYNLIFIAGARLRISVLNDFIPDFDAFEFAVF